MFNRKPAAQGRRLNWYAIVWLVILLQPGINALASERLAGVKTTCYFFHPSFCGFYIELTRFKTDRQIGSGENRWRH